MKYSIEGQELTDIADALRRKHGETRIETFEKIVVKTPNATGYDEHSGSVTGMYTQTVKVNGATKIVIDLGYSCNGINPLYMMAGEYNAENFPINDAAKYVTANYDKREIFTFENTDSVTLCYDCSDNSGYGYFYGECVAYAEIKNTYTSDEMAQAIDDIEIGVVLPEEAFIVTGNCSYRFTYSNWDWFIENYGHKITTKDIADGSYMFYMSSNMEEILFELNFKKDNDISLTRTFNGCTKLKNIPKINYVKPTSTENMFNGCSNIREIPDDFCDTWDWSYFDNLTSSYSGNRGGTFTNCYSLRKFPMEFFNHGNPVGASSYSIYYNAFSTCYNLDEIIDLPFPHSAVTWTANVFGNAFLNCSRIKDLTFAVQEDGTPYVMKWKTQIIDLSKNVGYYNNRAQSYSYIKNGYNSGIDYDSNVVYDDATYQERKNNKDWFTYAPNISNQYDAPYSRYNKDSAWRTIQSLPDTSAYLATAGGTNTIKFNGAQGSATDGGAINTLTAEQIAVASARGWTVTFV